LFLKLLTNLVNRKVWK